MQNLPNPDADAAYVGQWWHMDYIKEVQAFADKSESPRDDEIKAEWLGIIQLYFAIGDGYTVKPGYYDPVKRDGLDLYIVSFTDDNRKTTPIFVVELRAPTPRFDAPTSSAWATSSLSSYIRKLCKDNGIGGIGGALAHGVAVKFFDCTKSGMMTQRASASTSTDQHGALHLESDQKWVHMHLEQLTEKYTPS